MSTIYIASKTTVYGLSQYKHLYLVYDPDTDPTNGNESIIRGGPSDSAGMAADIALNYLSGPGSYSSDGGLYSIEVSEDISNSEDDFDIGDTPTSRNYTALDTMGLEESHIWTAMTAHADAIDQQGITYSLDYIVTSGFPENLDVIDGTNSNSVVGSTLNAIGLTPIGDQLPPDVTLGSVPGFSNTLSQVSVPADGFTWFSKRYQLGTDANDTLSGADHTANNYVFDGGGGSDTLDYASQGGTITITWQTSNYAIDDLGNEIWNIEDFSGASFEFQATDGDDTITGSSGNDVINGGLGDDLLIGGDGFDTYTYAINGGHDTINDTWFWDNNLYFDGLSASDATVDVENHDLKFSFDASNSVTYGDGAAPATTRYTEYISSSVGPTYSIRYETGNNGGFKADAYIGSNGDNDIFADDRDNLMVGFDGDDTLHGRGGDDVIYGGDGDDSLNTGYGNDALYGDDGNDYLILDGTNAQDLNSAFGGNGNDEFHLYGGLNTALGGAGNDWFTLESSSINANQFLHGDAGDDYFRIKDPTALNTYVVFGGEGSDYFHYRVNSFFTMQNDVVVNDSAGLDDRIHIKLYSSYTINDVTLSVVNSDDLYLSSASNGGIVIEDYFSTADSVETLETKWGSASTVLHDLSDLVFARLGFGTGGDDVITGDAGNNAFFGFAGSDTFDGGLGDDTLDGGDGIDTVSFASDTDRVLVDLRSDLARQGWDGTTGTTLDTLTSIENVSGSDYADRLIGDDAVNTIHGNAGNDVIYGMGGDDTIHGGDGNDEIYGDSETANAQDGHDTIYGDGGDDTIVGSGGDDLLHGGDGVDTIHGGGGQDTIWGDGGNDILYGNDDDDIIHGGDGEDLMYGNGGFDTLYGDGGNDQINGNEVTDHIYGGEGADWIWGYEDDDQLWGGNGNDTIYGDDQSNTAGWAGAGNDTLYGEAGNDVLAGGDGNDTLHGGADSDTLYGNHGDDILNGDAGTDLIYGGDGVDTLRGGLGNDTLLGNDGNDILYADEGVDRLWGQDGADIFTFEHATAFSGRDLVRDFDASEGDTIDISDVLDIAGYDDATDTLSDWVQITYAGAHSFLEVDRDGTGTTHGMTQIMYTENYSTLAMSDVTTV